jgi:hypothetical protein
MSSQRYLLGWL